MYNNLDVCDRHPTVPNWNALADELRVKAETPAWGSSSGPRDFEARLAEQRYAQKLCKDYGIQYNS